MIMKKMYFCESCGKYTLSLSHCGKATISAHPVKFRRKDKYGDLRRSRTYGV